MALAHRWLTLLLVALLLLPVAASARAQEPTPTPVALASLMPGASAFGKNWLIRDYVPYAAEEDSFTDGYGTFYGGPYGKRVMITILRNKPDRTSMNDAWEQVTAWVEADTADESFRIDPNRVIALSRAALPPGVADARRIDGTDWFMAMPMCTGAYAINPDLLIYTRVFGNIALTSGSNDGVNDCDNIAALIASHYPG
jgi:hypothetical protein